jgi:hypothetical protein
MCELVLKTGITARGALIHGAVRLPSENVPSGEMNQRLDRSGDCLVLLQTRPDIGEYDCVFP